MDQDEFDLSKCPVGKKVPYPTAYAPEVLFPIPRPWSRLKTFANKESLIRQFKGWDIWHDYEFVWHNTETQRKELRFMEIRFPAESLYLIESKSLKLYLFSFAQYMASPAQIVSRIAEDLSARCEALVEVELIECSDPRFQGKPSGLRLLYVPVINLDELRLDVTEFDLNPDLLLPALAQASEAESLSTDCFRANCLVTGKPDPARITIHYRGRLIPHSGLYRYLMSFRRHLGIHEQCIERIYADLWQRYKPEFLYVQGKFTRRGGLDISPVRYSESLGPVQWQRTLHA